MNEAAWCAGVDGCRAGWFVVLARFSEGSVAEVRYRLCREFAQVLALPEAPVKVAVDMPIGLLDCAEPGGRSCDRAARALLGPRKSSVFPPPARPALQAANYPEAVKANGAGISLPAWKILPKIREVDEVMTPDMQRRIVECHPELAFFSLAERPMRHNKKRPEGREERLALLRPHYGRWLDDLEVLRGRYGRGNLAMDDILDAAALALVARRIHSGQGHCLPEGGPPVDARGLRMEIWY